METQILTISSGRGPAECCWVVAQVLKQLLIEIRDAGLQYTIIDEQKGDQPGTYQSISVSVSGKNLTELKASWNGTIQWIGTSMYRKHHKRKNWFVAVTFRDDINLMDIDLTQLKFQTMRSGGKGGQHVNKVSTAVRITHISTNISVTSSAHRSQKQNKKVALQKLQMKLEEEQMEQAGQQASEDWQDKIEIQRGNPIKVFSSRKFKPTKSQTKKKYGSKRQQLKKELNKKIKNINHE